MKKWWLAAPLVVALLLVATPSDAGGRHHHHWRGGPRVFVGFGFGPAWGYPYWYYPPPPYYVYSPPPVIIQQQPPVYVEQQATVTPAPPIGSAPSAQSQAQFWYYCQPSGAYYPSVQTCTEPWIKVPPRNQ
ncbi:MAG TPA: hypothetical protein VGT02_03915 [Methylomirabilota bacterium]|nr:hypothetical protein [Methylomirabilota bacterium]